MNSTRTPDEVQALCEALKTGLEKYPEETDRMLRAFAICLKGGVTLRDTGTHTVESQRRAHTAYTVNGQCQCESWIGGQQNCVHRFAVALEKKAQAIRAAQFPPSEPTPQPVRYYATYQVPGGDPVPGTVVVLDLSGSLYFFPDHAQHQGCWVSAHEVSVGGNIAVAEAQKRQDGDLVKQASSSEHMCQRSQEGYYK